MGSPADTPEVRDPYWLQGASPVAKRPQRPPRATGDWWPSLAPGSLWHSLRQLGQGWTSWAHRDRRCSPCCGRPPVTLNGGDEPSATCHLHPPAASPGTWQEEGRSELGSRRGQSSGRCHSYCGMWSLRLPGTWLGTRWQKQHQDNLHKRFFLLRLLFFLRNLSPRKFYSLYSGHHGTPE